jgi:hypothetical protein
MFHSGPAQQHSRAIQGHRSLCWWRWSSLMGRCVVQKDRRRTDDTTELLNETNRVIQETLEDLKRLRACNEASKQMIRHSQRLVTEMKGDETIKTAPAIIPPTPRNNGTTWTPKQSAPAELLVAEARHVRARVKQAYRSCLRVTLSFTKTKEETRRLRHEATEILRRDVGWRL